MDEIIVYTGKRGETAYYYGGEYYTLESLL